MWILVCCHPAPGILEHGFKKRVIELLRFVSCIFVALILDPLRLLLRDFGSFLRLRLVLQHATPTLDMQLST